MCGVELLVVKLADLLGLADHVLQLVTVLDCAQPRFPTVVVGRYCSFVLL